MSRLVLVTGASGIGAAAARLAADRGWRVFTAALEASDCDGDLSIEDQAERAFHAALARHGQVDALLNVAGISGRRFGDGPIHECTVAGWDTVIRANARSTFLMSRAAVRHWLDRGSPGAIVNIASVLADSPEPGHFASHAYAASKGAMISLTKSMAAYYAGAGIRVNAIAPGLVRTAMSARAQQDAAIMEFVKAKQPLSSGILDATDVAAAALFLLSDEARHITGQVLAVDGGWSVTA